MSSIPGYTLEALIAWNFDLIVEGARDANASLRIAEALDVKTRRKFLTAEQFQPIVAYFEIHRESAESLLGDFNEETQSWKDYGGYCFDHIFTDSNWAFVETYLKSLEVL